MLLMLSVFALSVINGCKPFEVRASEEPDKPADWNPFQTTPSLTLGNLVYSYVFRENIYNYGNVFADGFQFHFDPQDAEDLHIPDRWGKTEEIDMLISVYQQILPEHEIALTLSVLPEQSDNIQSSRAWIYRGYVLTLNHSLSGIPQVFQGKMQLYMEKDNTGFWKIRDWYDYRVQNQWTWGKMKNAFAL